MPEVESLAHAFICWFRGHRWRYDGHIWRSGMAPYDCYLCETCGRRHAERVELTAAAPV